MKRIKNILIGLLILFQTLSTPLQGVVTILLAALWLFIWIMLGLVIEYRFGYTVANIYMIVLLVLHGLAFTTWLWLRPVKWIIHKFKHGTDDNTTSIS